MGRRVFFYLCEVGRRKDTIHLMASRKSPSGPLGSGKAFPPPAAPAMDVLVRALGDTQTPPRLKAANSTRWLRRIPSLARILISSGGPSQYHHLPKKSRILRSETVDVDSDEWDIGLCCKVPIQRIEQQSLASCRAFYSSITSCDTSVHLVN